MPRRGPARQASGASRGVGVDAEPLHELRRTDAERPDDLLGRVRDRGIRRVG
jgi:hypothetical protein